MNQCINSVVGLFQGPNQCAAIGLAVASFIAGMIAMCILCKLFCPCGKKTAAKGKCAAAKAQAKDGEDRQFEKRKPHPAPADGSVEIYVGNLSYDMTEDEVRAEFEKFGKISQLRLVTNRFNGKSKGFGFVQMPNRAEAEAACAALNDKEVKGRKMKVNEAKNLI